MGGQPWALPNIISTITREWMSQDLGASPKGKLTTSHILNIQHNPITADMCSEKLGQALLRVIQEVDKEARPGQRNTDPPAPKLLCTYSRQDIWQGGFLYNAGNATAATNIHKALNCTCLHTHQALTRFTITKSSAQEEFVIPELPKRTNEQRKEQTNGKEARLSGNLASFQ